MENRITENKVKIGEREFILTKFTPFFGVWLAIQTFGSLTGKKNKLEALMQSITSKPREEFEKLQQDVLKYCYEVLPAGRVAIVDENGNFAVANMDAPLALNLFIQTFMFSMTDFFDQRVMEDVMKGIENSLTHLKKSPQKN